MEQSITVDISNLVEKNLAVLSDSLSKINLSLHIITIDSNDQTFNELQEMIHTHSLNITVYNHNVDNKVESLYKLITELNEDENCGGIYLTDLLKEQLIDSASIYSMIKPDKDIDAKNVVNLGLMHYGNQLIWPVKVAAILKILESTNAPILNKKVTIIDNYMNLALNLIPALYQKSMIITVLNQFKTDWQKYTKTSDLVIANFRSILDDDVIIQSSQLKKKGMLIDLNHNVEPNIESSLSLFATNLEPLYRYYTLYNFVALCQLKQGE